MTRKTALATALGVVLTVVTASLAVAANLGMLTDEAPVGQLAPVSVPAVGGEPVVPTDAPTIYVDEDGNVLAGPDHARPNGAERGPASASADGRDDGAEEDDGREDEESGDDDDREHEDDEDGDDEDHEGRDDDD